MSDRRTLGRAGLAEAITREAGLPLHESRTIVGQILGYMCHSLANARGVKISGFGILRLHDTRAGIGRNPRTLEPYR